MRDLEVPVTAKAGQFPLLAAGLAISSIPMPALFVGGQEVARQAGSMPSGRVIAWAEAALPT